MKSFFTFWRFLLLNCLVLVLPVSPAHAQWKQISSPDGGVITSIYQYNSMYFVRTLNGIYRSTDNAQTWHNANLSLPLTYDLTPVKSFAASGNRLYAGTSYGIRVSVDSGNTWSSQGGGDIPSFLIAQDSIVLSARYTYETYPKSVIQRSSNYGTSWTKLQLPFLQFAQVTGLAITPTSVILTTAEHGMFRSSDQGKTWDTLKNNLSAEPLSTLHADGPLYYCGTSYGKIFRSSDNGDSWQELASTSVQVPVTSILASGAMLYYSTLGGGLFRSTDSGISWKECTTGPMNKRIYSVVGSPPNLLAHSDQGESVYRSTNSGETWEVANKGINAQQIFHIFSDFDTLYCSTLKSGFFRSTDRSASWEKLFTTLPADVQVTCFRRRGNSMFVGTTNKGIFRSRDNGQHWESIGKEIPPQYITSLALYNTSLSIIGEEAAIYVSTDDGDSWKNVSPGVDYVTGSLYIHDNILLASPYISVNNGQSWQFDSLGFRTKCLVEYDSILYAGTSGGLFKSENHGISWTLVGLKSREVSSVTISSTTIYALSSNPNPGSGSDRSLSYSINNGTTWRTFDLPLSINTYEIAVLGATIYAGTQNGIYTMVDTIFTGRDWFPAAVENEYIRSITTIDSTVFAGIEEKGVMKSILYTRTWVKANTGLDNLFVRKVVSKGSFLVAGTLGGLYVSRDKGEHWTTTNSLLSSKSILTLEWKGTLLFASASTGGLYRSSDSGSTWTQIYTGNPANPISTLSATSTTLFAGSDNQILRSLDNGDTWEIITIPSNPSAVYSIYTRSEMVLASTAFDGIYKSTDNGTTWTQSNTGLTTKLVWTIVSNGQAIFAGTVTGVFSSTDEGTTWHAFGLQGNYITALHATPTAVYAGLQGSSGLINASVWRALLQPTSVSEPHENEVVPHSGLTCYPNPATTTLTIDYSSLPFQASLPVLCTITTITGEVLKQAELTEPQTTLPLEEYGSGVYMIILRQGAMQRTTTFSIFH